MDLKNLDKTIVELEKSSKELKDVSVVYAEIARLQDEISSSLTQGKENNVKLSKMNALVESSLAKTKEDADTLKAFLEKELQTLLKDNKILSKRPRC